MTSNKKLSIIILLLFLICNLNIHCKNNDYNKNDTILEKKYYNIIENLKNDYVLDPPRFQAVGQMDVVMVYLSDLKKSFQEYQSDSTKFYQAIVDIFKTDYSFINYLYKFRNDTSYRKLSLAGFDKSITGFNSNWTDKMFSEMEFYKKMNNIALTLILNYYLNTEQQTIKLYLDVVYIENKSKKTEKMYKKLDKIFKIYGYEDKEKIRNAILKNFGKCIDYNQLPTE